MPTRKQRRRRQKGLRHEYEYVYVDDEGHEVEVDEAPDSASRRNGKRDSKPASAARPQAGKGKQRRPIREVSPPSWSRVAKRALVFGPLIFVAFSVINSSQSVASRLLIAAAYTAFFIPLMYLMDRTMYRTYLKRTGGQPPQRASRKR
jgi:hypothetical protein